MPAVKLTQKAVEATTGKAKREEHPDALVPGLRLVVQPSGAKSWALRYRHAGAPRKLVLGPLSPVLDGVEPEPTLGLPLTLKGAREVARQQLQVLATGRDPAQENQARKRAAREPQQVAERDLVRNVAADFLAKYLKPSAKPGYYTSTKRILDVDVLPVLGARRIQDIGRCDVLDLLDAVVERGAATQANRILAAVRKMFSWAVSRDIIDDSPARGVKPPTPETPRERFLTDEELRLVWLASGEIGYPWGTMTQLLVLTGARRDEAAGLRRSELSADGAVWTLPGARTGRTKNKREHKVWLSPQAQAVIEAAPRVVVGASEIDVPKHKGVRDFVFSSTGRTPISGYHKGKGAIDAAMLKIAKREAEERGDDLAEVTLAPWRWHDLRRTMASGMQRLGVDFAVSDRALNHTIPGVGGGYHQYDFASERKAALKAWGRRVENIATGRGGNVVPMKRTRRKTSSK